jgi:hypothetical protein
MRGYGHRQLHVSPSTLPGMRDGEVAGAKQSNASRHSLSSRHGIGDPHADVISRERYIEDLTSRGSIARSGLFLSDSSRFCQAK